jgi:transposase-like protein
VNNTLKLDSFVLKLVDLFDEAFCRKLLFDLTRGTGCRYCGKSIPKEHLDRFYAGKEVYCRFCDSRFFAVSGTILSQSKLSYKQILKILVMLDLGFKTKEIAAAVDVSSHCIPRWRKKLSEFENE